MSGPIGRYISIFRVWDLGIQVIAYKLVVDGLRFTSLDQDSKQNPDSWSSKITGCRPVKIVIPHVHIGTVCNIEGYQPRFWSFDEILEVVLDRGSILVPPCSLVEHRGIGQCWYHVQKSHIHIFYVDEEEAGTPKAPHRWRKPTRSSPGHADSLLAPCKPGAKKAKYLSTETLCYSLRCGTLS